MLINSDKLAAAGLDVVIIPKAVRQALHGWLTTTMRPRDLSRPDSVIGTRAWEALDESRKYHLRLAYVCTAEERPIVHLLKNMLPGPVEEPFFPVDVWVKGDGREFDFSSFRAAQSFAMSHRAEYPESVKVGDNTKWRVVL